MTDEAYSVSSAAAGHGGGPEETRRDFLILVAGAMGVLGAGAAAYTLIDSMNPAADVLAAGEPVEVDLSKVQPWPADHRAVARQADFCRRSDATAGQNAARSQADRAPERSPIRGKPATALRKELASLNRPQIFGAGRDLYSSGLHSELLSLTLIRSIQYLIGLAGISVLATVRNTIWPVTCSNMFRRLIICRSLRIIFPTSRHCASAPTLPIRIGTSIRLSRSKRAGTGGLERSPSIGDSEHDQACTCATIRA